MTIYVHDPCVWHLSCFVLYFLYVIQAVGIDIMLETTQKKQWPYLVVIIAWLAVNGMSYAYEIELNKQGKSYALLIGINQYTNYPDLQTPTKNVDTLAKILIKQYDFQSNTIFKITNKTSPTYAVIEKKLIDLGNRLTEKDQLLIYFSGHCQMDENGITYWLPADSEPSKKNWLSHKYLINTIIQRNMNAIRHIVIISEGFFSRHLFQEHKMPPFVSQTLYKDWLNKKSYLKSREIFVLNDHFWDKNKKTKGLGLFAYYLTQAFSHVKKRRVSLSDTLLNSDLIHGPIRRMTGVDVIYGRIKNVNDQEGQFVLEKAKRLPIVNIASCQTNPSIGYTGDVFLVSCETTGPASRVSIKMNGRFYQMTGIDRLWKYQARIKHTGKTLYYVTSWNEEKVKGKQYKGSFKTVMPTPLVCNVVSSRVSPPKGRIGKTFNFYAKTDIPTDHVDLYLNNQKYAMRGQNKNWSFSKQINTIGKSYYTMVTSNTSGIIGSIQQGFIETDVPPVNVTRSRVKPEYGYVGDEFIFTCVTDRTAKEVFIEINDETYAMRGSLRDWIFKIQINKPGLVEYEIVALNQLKEKGERQSGNFSISRKPLEIPDVSQISVLPQTIYKGESFLIHAQTSSPARMVYIDLNTQKDIFKGKGTDWFYTTRMHKSQHINFRIVAKNHRGMQGLAQDQMVHIREVPMDTIKIIHAEVSPKKCDVGSDVFFHVLTDKPSKKVNLILNNDQIPMNGQDREWQLTQSIDTMGLLYFAIIPINARNIKGLSYIDHIEITPGNPKVKWIRTSPEHPSPNEPVTIHAHTNKPAKRMILQMNNISYPMNTAYRDFYFKHVFTEPKIYHFTIQPYNLKDSPGIASKGRVKIVEPKAPIPGVASVKVKPMETGYFLNEALLFTAITDVPAKRTVLVLNNTSIEMNGVHTIWHINYVNNKIGLNTFTITSYNKNNQSGKSKSGQFQVYQKQEKPVNITQVNVSPKQGKPGDLFHFSAITDQKAQLVKLIIEDSAYEMSGRDTRWHTQLKGYKTGDNLFYIVALNRTGRSGMIQTGIFSINEPATISKPIVIQAPTFTLLPSKDRFEDHGNGTVTDKSTQLMWTKAPKTMPETYENAVNYCQRLNIKGLCCWRLPTIEEWKQMVDHSQQNPALPPDHPFESIHTSIGYWSKTSHRFGPQYKYKMKLWYGKTGYMNKSQRALVWPVRYAGFD
jgi:hypothetical protein